MPNVDPNPPASNFDTEGVQGQEGTAPVGTAAEVDQRDTTVFGGGAGTDPHPTIDNQPVFGRYTTYNNDEIDTADVTSDTTSAGVNNDAFPEAPVNTDLDATIPTTNVDQPLGVEPTNNVYVAPNFAGAPLTTFDSTRTNDIQASSGNGPRIRTLDLDGTTETAFIGGGFGSVPVIDPSTPNAPSDVYVQAGPRSVRVTWQSANDVPGAPVRNYIIFDNNGGTFRADRDGGSWYKGTDIEAEPSIPIRVQVAAVNDNGVSVKSDWSSYVTPWNEDENDNYEPGGYYWRNIKEGIWTPYGELKPGTGSPSKVRNLRVTSVEDETVNLAWDAPNTWGGDDPWIYVILVVIDGVIVDGDDVNSSTTTYSWSGLTNDTEYEFVVFAVNDSEIDGPYEIVSGTPRNSVPDAPLDVRAFRSGSGSVHVTWTNASDGGNVITDSHVYVYKGLEEIDDITTGETDGAIGYTVTGLDSEVTYVFRVTTVNTLGESDKSGASDPVVVA